MSRGFLERYNVPGPRYTSYPTAPEWRDDFGPEDFRRALRESDPSPLSLYFHIPFCESLCLFCACNTVISRDKEVSGPYLTHLKQEIDAVHRELPEGPSTSLGAGRPVVQLHWGGGTPTYLSTGQIEELFAHIQERFSFDPGAEVSVEVDPRVTTEEQVRLLRRLGFNRISLGIQDFDLLVQKTVRRIESPEAVRALIQLCRSLGFSSVNVDLIYGLPHQTVGSFAGTVDRILEFDPDRIALFSYAHVPWLHRQQKSFEKHLPTSREKFRIFRMAIESFTSAGYVYIGMDHFAKPQDELTLAQQARTLHRNFQGYTTKAGANLIGMGVTSISALDGVYAQNQRELEAYHAAVEAHGLASHRGWKLGEDDLIRRSVISRILCHGVVFKHEVEQQFGIDFDQYFATALEGLEALEADGLVVLSPGQIRTTLLGRLFLRILAMPFDAYLARHASAEKRVFSRTL
ncbi:MAG: oxygen-independent coproporphyrinogen III oxidase [Acidobacteria bacterium]|nr:oxygen-independent coproporphyrinogen III oxidase [Acidobacteriota bacterium]